MGCDLILTRMVYFCAVMYRLGSAWLDNLIQLMHSFLARVIVRSIGRAFPPWPAANSSFAS